MPPLLTSTRHPQSRRMRRIPVVAGIGLVVAGLVAAPAGAFLDRLGNTIANTSTASPSAQLAGPPQTVQLLASPQDPSINNPATLAKLGSPTSPEEDLSAALAQIGSTT